MAQQTQQVQALAAAAAVASYMSQLRSLQNAVNAFLLTYADQSYASIWQVLPTYAFASPGQPGLYDQSAGSGTVSVTSGSTAITFSASQSGLTGKYLVVTGDTSNGVYPIGSGSGTSWVLGAPFGGNSLSGASWGTTNPVGANPIALPSGSPLNMAYNNLLTSVGCLENFQSYMTGAAISSQANTPQKFADLLNS